MQAAKIYSVAHQIQLSVGEFADDACHAEANMKMCEYSHVLSFHFNALSMKFDVLKKLEPKKQSSFLCNSEVSVVELKC